MENIAQSGKTTGQLAKLVNARIIGDTGRLITGVASLWSASKGSIAFLSNPKYIPLLKTTKASAVVVGKSLTKARPVLLCVDNPDAAFARITELFAPAPAPLLKGIHPTAVIARNARLGKGVAVGAHAVIEEGCVIGDRSVVNPHVYIGRETVAGTDCVFLPGVIIRDRIVIGNRVTIHSGTVIGSEGFGYCVDQSGRRERIRHVGTVVIEDDVEIGANCAIDRARFDKTVIGAGTKTDNLVQVGHNVIIGRNAVLVAQVGICGSTRVGNGVILAGQVGVEGHIEIGDNSIVTAKGSVTKSLPAGSVVSGYPMRPHTLFKREQALVRKLPETNARIHKLQQQVESLLEKVRSLEEAAKNRKKAR
jgi:UDP-3-O-[3-hydroxymyristoyl] glucosamine N-acyltransferase